MITNLGMRGDDYQHSRIQQISDDVIKSFGVKLDYVLVLRLFTRNIGFNTSYIAFPAAHSDHSFT